MIKRIISCIVSTVIVLGATIAYDRTPACRLLTDDNGTTVNPHERPAGEKHDENPATCTDCHNNHSKDLGKDAKKYCAQCHHRGVYECGTCHELRERSAK